MAKNENIVIRMLKGIGSGLAAEIMCAFLVLSLAALSAAMGGAVWIKIFIAVCTLCIDWGMYFNWAVKAAHTDRDAVKYHGVEHDGGMAVKMALTGPAVSYISFIALVLSKAGVLPDIFSIYLLLNLFQMPFVDAFTSGRTLEYLSVPGIAGLFVLTASQSAVIIATYVMTYRDVDVKSLLMYKK